MKNLREEIEFKGSGGLTDVFDDAIKGLFNITDDEYDFIASEATDEELDLFLSGLGSLDTPATFSEKRKSLEVRNKYLKLFNEQ
jgi:hypothetical protein